MKNAAVAAPVAIVSSGRLFVHLSLSTAHRTFLIVIVTAILGFFVNVAMCYGIRDYDALPGPTGLAFAQVTFVIQVIEDFLKHSNQILWDNLGKRGALVMWSFVILALFVSVGISHMACVRSKYALISLMSLY